MRIADLSKTTVVAESKATVTPTVQRLLETREEQFGKPMTAQELMQWVKSL
jgi:hypothetical protein